MNHVQAPYQSDDAFLADVASTRGERTRNFRIWWLGQSGFLIQYQGRHVLLDPYLSDSLTKKYAATDKPHVRMTGLVIDPARLDFIDAVTSSHNHTDHLDAETLGPLIAANPGIELIAPEANRAFVANRIGSDVSFPIGLRDGESVEAGAFRFTAVPAAHEELSPEYLGYIVQFGEWSIYHSGDTILYEGMAERLRPFAPDLALLPINGRARERRVAGNLNAHEAAHLAKSIGAGRVIPCHYDLFTFNTADPVEFAKIADELQQPYTILGNGESWSSNYELS